MDYTKESINWKDSVEDKMMSIGQTTFNLNKNYDELDVKFERTLALLEVRIIFIQVYKIFILQFFNFQGKTQLSFIRELHR